MHLLNSNNENLFKLRTIVEYYKRMPDTDFLLFEAYIDNGFNKKGKPDVKVVFEIIDYTREKAEKSDIDETYASGTGICNLSSEINPGKKYSVLSGKEISDRAMRLQKLLEANYIQPPGKLMDGSGHVGLDIKGIEGSKYEQQEQVNIKCDHWKTCVFRNYCPLKKQVKIKGLRVGSGRSEDVKALQTILFKFGYGDEMRFEKYKTDGRFGKRTNLALESFIEEVNYLEGKSLLYGRNHKIIDENLHLELIDKCKNNWERKKYYHFLDSKWDTVIGPRKGELNWLKWRYHVRQLQGDLEYFTIVNMKLLPFSNKNTDIEKPLNALWEKGRYDKWTDQAISCFADAAAAGIRYNPLNKRLEYTLEDPTYTGKLEGPVDASIKNEIKAWFDEIEHIMHIPDLDITGEPDEPLPDISSSRILHPQTGSTILTREKEVFEIILSVPDKVNGIEITADRLNHLLPYYLFMHKPFDEDKPFLSDTYKPSYFRENRCKIESIIALDQYKYMFYPGNVNESRPAEYTAKYIDSGPEKEWDEDEHLFVDVGDPERELNIGLDENEIKPFDETIKKKIQAVYDSKYEGLLEKEANAGNNLWEIRLQLSDMVFPGLYLLKIKSSNDEKPHPVRIFKADTDVFRILHLTDLHIAERWDYLNDLYPLELEGYSNPNERLKDILNHVKSGKIEADFIIITGDVIDNSNNFHPYDGRDGKYYFKPVIDTDKNWRYLHSILVEEPGAGIPFYICLGNHDFRHNPCAIHHYSKDLNLKKSVAEKFPHDTRDTGGLFFNVGDIRAKWAGDNCFGDILFASERAVQYYYENICPFSDFNISINELNFILMNSGHDEKIFFNSFDITDIAIATKAAMGRNPAPRSTGLTNKQLKWLDKVIQKNLEKTNVLCMHSPLINPPDSAMVVWSDSTFLWQDEKEITDSVNNYTESCILFGRETILKYLEENKLNLILTGHTHKNCEIRCCFLDGDFKYFTGNYSGEMPFAIDPVDISQSRLILSTISSGLVGINFLLKSSNDIDLADIVDVFANFPDISGLDFHVERSYSHLGYRTLAIEKNGTINDFESHILLSPRIIVE